MSVVSSAPIIFVTPGLFTIYKFTFLYFLGGLRGVFQPRAHL